MVNLTDLEAQKAQAEKEKEENIVKAQIKVYESQTYEARDAYAEAKAKRGKSRAKLPEKIPEDSTYKENLLQAQYAKARAKVQSQSDQVDEYTTQIKIQQEAKETTRILDEQMPALLYKAEQEVESVKESVYVTAKETATKKQELHIQSLDTQIESEKQRRADEISAVTTKWDSNKSPWHDGKTQFGNYAESDNNNRRNAWIKNQAQGKADALAQVRKSHLDADGFQPASVNRGGFIPMPTHPTAKKLYTGEAINQHASKALQSGVSASSIGNRWTRYQVEISRANQAVYAGGSLSAHASAVQSAKNTFDGLALKEQKKHSAQARAESAGQLAQDQKHWDNVVETNWSVVTANQKKVDSLGLDHNVADLSSKGLSTLYNVGDLQVNADGVTSEKKYTTVDMMKAGFLPKASTVGIDSTVTGYKRADSPVIGMKLDTSPKLSSNVVGLNLAPPVITGSYNSNPLLNGTLTSRQIDSKDYKSQVNAYTDNVYKQQRVTELANQRQTAYTNELVAGNVGIATALLNPQTTQSYIGNDTRNLKEYLSKRGFDISNPDTIPDSVFYPTKGVSGKVDSKGEFIIPSQPVISSDVLRKRTEARARWESITVPTMPSNPLVAPAPKQKQAKTQDEMLSGSSLISAKVKPPTWTFNNQSFTSKDKLDAYVKSRNTQAQFNSDKTKLNYIQNKTGSLNPEGYIEGFVSPVNDPFKHSLSDVKGTKYDGMSLTDAIDTKQSEKDSMLKTAQFNSDKTKLNYIQNKTGSLNPEGYIEGFVAPTPYTRYDDPTPTPQWTVGGKTFTTKSDLIEHVRSGKDATFKEAKLNTETNKLLNEKSNITGSLNYTDSILGLKPSTSNSITESSNTNPTVPQWNVDGKTFTSKSEFTKYVKSQSDSVFAQASLNTDKNKLLNIKTELFNQPNITGTLNPAPETKNSLLKTSTGTPTVPQWSVDGKTFTSKSEFTKYVKSGKDEILKQAQVTSDKSKIDLLPIPNTSGKLNPEGYIKPTTTVLDVPSNTSGVTTAPTFTFNNKTFESKDELDTFVKSSSATKLEQSKSGITNPINSLLADGYTTKVKDAMFANSPTGDSRYSNTGYKPDAKPVTDASKVITSYNSNQALNKGGTLATTNDGLPSTYTGNIFSVTDSVTGITKEFRKEKEAQKYVDFVNNKNNPLPPKPQWVVSSDERVTIPKMGGGQTFTVIQKQNVFDSLAEAESFDKAQKSAKAFGDYENYSLANYSHSVRTGLLEEPTTWQGQTALKFSQAFEPMSNVGKSVNNMVGGKEMAYTETAEEMFISGTIDDVVSGNPFKGTGLTSAVDEIIKDPSRFVAQLPATAVMYVGGGKAIALGSQGVRKGIGLLSTQLDNVGMSGGRLSTPAIITKDVGVAINTGVKTVTAVPMKMVQAGYQKVDSYMMQPPSTVNSMYVKQAYGVTKQGVISVDRKFNVFQDQRVGFSTKANFILTPSGRLFVKDSTKIAGNMGVKPQFLNRQVAMFENEGVTGFATRGKIKTTTYELPKEVPFKSDAFTPTGKTKLIPKEGLPKVDKPFPELYDSKATTTGKPFPDLVKVEDIPVTKINTPNPFDRLKNVVFKDSETMPAIKKVKTAVDEVTFYSDTTGDLIKGVKRPQAEIQGELNNYKAFDSPNITGTRDSLTSFRTSTSQPVIVKTKVLGGKVKLTQLKHKDTVATGAEIKGTDNLKLIDDMVEEGQLEEIGKKTVMKGEDYFGGGKKFNLKQDLESRNPTTFESATGKIKPKDETIIYGVSKKTIPVDKTAFSQTMKESNLLRDIGNPLNKKPVVPKGVDEPAEQYHAFIGESKSVGGTFQGTRISLGSGKGVTGVVTSTGIVKPTYPSFPVNKFTGTKVNVGSGDATSTTVSQSKVIPALPVNKFTGTKVNLGTKNPVKEISLSEVAEDSSVNIPKWGSVGGGRKSAVNNTDDDIPKGFKAEGDKTQTLLKETKTEQDVPTKQKTKTEQVQTPLQMPKVKAGVKPPKTFQIPAQVQMPKVKAGVKPPKVSPKIKQIVTPVISQKTETGLVQKTSQLTKQKIKQVPKVKQVPKIKQAQRLRLVQSAVTVTSQSQKQAQVQMTSMMKSPFIQRTVRRKSAIIIKIPTPEPEVRGRKGKKGNKAGYIGNVRLDNIMGMYKRKEITYGEKKVTKLERQDARLTSGTPNRIAQPSSGLLTKKKKKTKKSVSVFGGGKDEFKGFVSKTKKKSKGKKKLSLFG